MQTRAHETAAKASIHVGSYGFLSASCGFLSLAFAHETAAKACILVGSYGLLSASCGFLSLAFAHETAAKAIILVGSYRSGAIETQEQEP